MKTLTFLFLIILLIHSSSIQKEDHCFLTGKVFDRDSKLLLLCKTTEDVRNRKIEIPINEDGTFSFNLQYEVQEQYDLIFKDELDNSVWRPTSFFPDSDTVKFELHPMREAHNNLINGGRLNLEKSTFIHEQKKYFEKEYRYWSKKRDSLRKNNDLNSEQMNIINLKMDSIRKSTVQYNRNYIANKPTIFGYSIFLRMLDQAKMTNTSLDTLNKYFNILKIRYPNHPYTMISTNKLYGLENIVVGGKYVDFSASNENGIIIDVSSVIDSNKLTLIDLWAPWCGPCIKKSRGIIPLYKKYKKLGFEVVGVVGGIDSNENFHKSISRHKYPWESLAEINEENRLWEKYNIANSGGGQFLVDKNGTILSINPDPKDLENFLIKM